MELLLYTLGNVCNDCRYAYLRACVCNDVGARLHCCSMLCQNKKTFILTMRLLHGYAGRVCIRINNATVIEWREFIRWCKGEASERRVCSSSVLLDDSLTDINQA